MWPIRNEHSHHLAERASELDGETVTEVAIGLADGPLGRFRALQRLRTTLRDAVGKAGQAARVIAEEGEERLMDPSARPSSIRVAEHPAGVTVLLDYEVKSRGGRPSRPLRLIMLARTAPTADTVS